MNSTEAIALLSPEPQEPDTEILGGQTLES
jgi:hypothetical protein